MTEDQIRKGFEHWLGGEAFAFKALLTYKRPDGAYANELLELAWQCYNAGAFWGMTT